LAHYFPTHFQIIIIIIIKEEVDQKNKKENQELINWEVKWRSRKKKRGIKFKHNKREKGERRKKYHCNQTVVLLLTCVASSKHSQRAASNYTKEAND